MRTHDLRQELLAHCIELGLFTPDAKLDLDEDLVESGLVDSMALVSLHAFVDDVYGVSIPAAVFATELRSINRIVRYIGEALAARPRSDRAGAPQPASN